MFFFCREDYNGITTFTELLNFTGKICLFCINKELYFFSQLLKYYNPKSEKVGTVWKTQIKKESSDF